MTHFNEVLQLFLAFLNEHYGRRSGYYLSSGCAALGSCVLFFIDAHKKREAKKRQLSSSGTETAAVDLSPTKATPAPHLGQINTSKRSMDSADITSTHLPPTRLLLINVSEGHDIEIR